MSRGRKESEGKILAAAVKRLELLHKQECFDPAHPESRPTPAQQEIISDFGKVRTQWIVAANRAGKSRGCGRAISWALTDTHPSWKMPEEWRKSGMLVVVAGRKSSHIEETLWPTIRDFLDSSTYKEVRVGNILQRVEVNNPHGGTHRIIFQSMENVNIARERLQSFTAHIAWLDEMVDSASAIAEMQLRVATTGGFFMASFTPLKYAPAVRKLVDSADGKYAKVYKLKTLDNPVFADPDKRAALLSSFEGMPEWEIRTRLEGEWATGEENVYHFDYDEIVKQPQGYSALWRHVESVDPAMSGATGLTVWTEDPATGVWYCVLAEYVKGVYDPRALVSTIRDKTSLFNIVRRISDPHEVWYIRTAASMGINYLGVHKKNERKDELIKNFQSFLSSGMGKIAPLCEHLIDELQDCRWSDRTTGKIVRASSFHLLDASHYFVDLKPKADSTLKPAASWDEFLLRANEERILKREKEKAKQEKKALRKTRVRKNNNNNWWTNFRGQVRQRGE